MTETTSEEVQQLQEAFAKVSTLLVQSQLNDFKREQSETNQRLELTLQRMVKENELLTIRLQDAEQEIAWLKTALAKQETRIDSAARYVKGLNGK